MTSLGISNCTKKNWKSVYNTCQQPVSHVHVTVRWTHPYENKALVSICYNRYKTTTVGAGPSAPAFVRTFHPRVGGLFGSSRNAGAM